MNRPRRMNRVSSVLAAVALAAALAPVAVAEDGDFARTAASAQKDLEQSIAELAALREQIAAEKLPLNRELRELEQRLVDVRAESQEVNKQLDQRGLDLSELETDIKARHEEHDYLTTLLDEYARSFESRVHVTELQRYEQLLAGAKQAAENPDLDPQAADAARIALVEGSLERLQDLLGGTSFDGRAVDAKGRVQDVRFALVGPVALYGTPDGASAGLAEQKLGSLEPNMVELAEPGLQAQARAVVSDGRGMLPLDPTLGSAQLIEETEDTLLQQVEKGGPVMIPILLLAAAALVIGIVKWIELARVRVPPARSVSAVLDALRARDYAGAAARAREMSGPTGEMLRAGIDHVAEPKELIEEVMYERVLETRLKLQRLLSFIAVSAAAAPLLGLLGTVTGIINTFKLITVFGTGDPKTLSSGISEALITTEFGLVVAIPALFLHAYLSRKAKRFIDRMEKTAVSFLNRILSGPAGGGLDLPSSGGEVKPRPADVPVAGAVWNPLPAHEKVDH